MPSLGHIAWRVGIVCILLTGCVTTQNQIRELPPEEQPLYRAYSRLMTNRQNHTYLSLQTPQERAAYAREIGVAQRLEALPPNEQKAVLNGVMRKGLSRDALHMIWGRYCWKEGPEWNEHWYYYGDTMSLSEIGWHCSPESTVTEVLLIDGVVQWWKETIPDPPGLFPRRRLFW